jgi:hypothetical protein
MTKPKKESELLKGWQQIATLACRILPKVEQRKLATSYRDLHISRRALELL